MDVSVRKKIQNVRPSLRAILELWRTELSFRLQSACAAIVILLSWILHISKTEFLFVIGAVGSVLAIEALNTAVEELCDHVTPEQHPHIGIIKDLGSAASALIGLTALIIGLTIFIPYILAFI